MEQQYRLEPEKWVDKYSDYLFGYAISRVQQVYIAEDLIQETFLSAYKYRKNFKGISTEKTWLTSILKNKITDHYRKNIRTKEDKLIDGYSPFQKEGSFNGFWEEKHVPKTWDPNKFDSLDSKEFYEILQLCMSLLPEKWAATFTLKILEELSTEEVCKEIDISTSNLWVLLHRARAQLRECFEKKWLNE